MVQYHFRTKEGPSLGPIGAEEFRLRLEAGDIDDETMVWRSGMLDWTTYANLRAIEERAAQPPPLPSQAPPPLPVKESHHAAARASVQFIACAACGQDWPENLLNLHGRKHVCGNCVRTQKDTFKKIQHKNAKSEISAGWVAWLVKVLLIGAIICGVIFVRLWLRSETRKSKRVLRQQYEQREQSPEKLPAREGTPAAAP
jgi:hypothetical protein